jgi:hypothetical protein
MEDYGYYIIISIGLVAFICFPIVIICYDLCYKEDKNKNNNNNKNKNKNNNNNNIEIERIPLITKV